LKNERSQTIQTDQTGYLYYVQLDLQFYGQTVKCKNQTCTKTSAVSSNSTDSCTFSNWRNAKHSQQCYSTVCWGYLYLPRKLLLTAVWNYHTTNATKLKLLYKMTLIQNLYCH